MIKQKFDYYLICPSRKIKISPGKPCNHPGCISYKTHSCEGCGRIATKGNVYENPLEKGTKNDMSPNESD